MVAINITKYSQFTEHFYCSFWSVSPYTDLKLIESGFLTLKNDVFSNMEMTKGNYYCSIKDSNEKQLLIKAKNFLNENCGSAANIIVVFYDGKYSSSRSEHIMNLN